MKKHGFTMVELMIVIAIIAVLASIILPKMSGARERAKMNACKANVRLIGIAAQLYSTDNNGIFYPLWDINEDLTESTVYYQQGYLKSIPRCPANVDYYILNGLSNGSSFHVFCARGHSYFNPIITPRWDIKRGGVREDAFQEP